MDVDITSLLVGLAIATILWWMITRARPLWTQLASELRKRRRDVEVGQIGDVETNHRRHVLRRAQGMHLASQLFALDEVLEIPLFLAPPPRVEPEAPIAAEDAVTLTVPYLPAWPELGAVYGAPTLTVEQALAGGVHLLIIGQPGSGKTVALGYLASLAANRRDDLGQLRGHVPFLLHAGELQLPLSQRKDLLNAVVDSAVEASSLFDDDRMEEFVQASFRDGRALLLVDGYDELTGNAQRDVGAYLRLLLSEFPRTRIVICGAPEYVDGLLDMGFVPVALLPWTEHKQTQFIGRWLTLWRNTIGLENTSPLQNQLPETTILTSWLQPDGCGATPLELTLRLWAACAGDWTGSSSLDAIQAHLRRLVPADTPEGALETLAMQVMLTAQPFFDARSARDWVGKFELPAAASPGGVSVAGSNAEIERGTSIAQRFGKRRRGLESTIPGLLGRLGATGLIVSLPGSRMKFLHPVFIGYLAGKGLKDFDAEEALINQPEWTGKLITMRYFAAHGDAGPMATKYLEWSRLPLQRPTLTLARWLRDSSGEAAWRSQVLSALVDLIRTPGLPLGLRGQAVAALVASGDQSVTLVFRRLLESRSSDVVQLAALGTGVLRDPKAIPNLRTALLSTSLEVRRAACLALASIGTTEALEALGEALLKGDDDLRRAAAESLANEPLEGHAMLRDGASMADIPLRRAVAYGLGRISDAWATGVLEKMRLEDEQWVVRNAASEMVELRGNRIGGRTPRLLPPPSESPWLLRFAATKGLGISAGAPATEILLEALESPHVDERLAAVEYLKINPTEATVRQLYAVMGGDDIELREAAFQAVWELGSAGYRLPDPAKYGLN